MAFAFFGGQLSFANYRRFLKKLPAPVLTQDPIVLHFLVKTPERTLYRFISIYNDFGQTVSPPLIFL